MYSQEWRNVLEIAYYGTMYEWVLAIAVGLVGGIANSVIFGGGFKLPGTVENEDGETIYDPGFVGAIFISGIAGFLAWAYSTDASFVDQAPNVKPLAGALLAGIAGSRALAIVVDRQFGAGATEQTESAAEDLATALANITDELTEVREVERTLRDEITNLRNQAEKSGDSDE